MNKRTVALTAEQYVWITGPIRESQLRWWWKQTWVCGSPTFPVS